MVHRIWLWSILFLTAFIFLATASPAQRQDSAGPRLHRVLLLHSFEPLLPYSTIVSQSVRQTLLASKGEEYEFYSEYLDLARFPGRDHEAKLVSLLGEKYRKAKPDIVIAVLVPALDFALKHRKEVFGNAPLIFCGIEPAHVKTMNLDRNVTGVLIELDPKATLEAALRLQPETERVVVVGGASKNDRVFNDAVLQAFEEYKGRLQFTSLIAKPIEAIYDDVKKLPPRTIVFYITMFRDGKGEAQVPAVVAGRLPKASSVPVYSLFDSYFGAGIVGGRLVSFEMQGKTAGQISYRILHGENPAAIPYVPSPNVNLFDWRQLKKWGLSEERLPPSSSLRFKEYTLWDHYKWWIVGVSVFVILEALLIIFLLIHRARRRRAEGALIAEKERFLTLAENAPFGLVLVSKDDVITYRNPLFNSLFGYDPLDTPTAGLWLSMAFSGSETRVGQVMERWKVFRQEGSPIDKRDLVETVACKDGSRRIVRFIAVPLGTGEVVVTVEDITERKQLESQLVQAQKMEAVGTLAGGVAHDFNNILSVITGFAGLLQMQMPLDHLGKSYVDQILAASEKAVFLTTSLLAFSRKQMIDPKPVDLNTAIEKTRKILSRLIGEDIDMTTVLSDGEPVAMVDEGQLDQILINLAANARDAMPNGGALVVSADIAEIDEAFIARHGYGKAGVYATLSVSDTGEGMDEATKNRIFEPFFTTKEVGRGTGLGLAIVYGIVKQHNGYIVVETARDLGTTFTIFFPLAPRGSTGYPRKMQAALPGGSETILIGEDEETLREFLKTLFTSMGYSVLCACDGEDTVRQFEEHQDLIDLVLLDVVMPKMNGREVYTAIRKVKASVPVVFSSGYTFDTIHRKGVQEEGLEFIQKPLKPDELLRRIRTVLDSSRTPQS